MITKWVPQFDRLAENYQQKVEEQFETLPLDEIRETYEEVYVNPKAVDMTTVEEVPFVSREELDIEKLAGTAKEAGKNGEVAALLRAGGQGTRLEHPGPKGTVSCGGLSLSELQATQMRAAGHESGPPVDWYAMTSGIE